MTDTRITEPGAGVTDRLAGWAAGLAVPDIPQEVREQAARLMLDGLGAGLFGGTTPWGRTVRDLVLESGGVAEAAVWGSGRRAPAAEASLVNGTLMHSFEVDDLHAPAVLHGAAQVLPPALAVAGLRAAGERDGLPADLPGDGDLLLACVAGLEVGARVGMLTGAAQLGRGFHPSPNTGLFSAAVTAGLLLGLDGPRLTHAIGIAASSGGFLMAAQYGAVVKRLHPGRAAQAGVQAALLAARGFTGIAEVLEEPYGGFARAYAGLQDAEEVATVLEGLGERWETLRFSPKAYPCCGSNHTSVDACLDILADVPDLSPDDVESVWIACSTRTQEHVGWPYRPDSVTTAQMNLAYTVAVTILDGELSVDQFDVARTTDPRVLDLARRVQVGADPAIDAEGREGRHAVHLTVALRDGTSYSRTVRHARGSAHRPLSPEEVHAKFQRLAGAALGPARVKELEQAVTEIADAGPGSSGLTTVLDILDEARS